MQKHTVLVMTLGLMIAQSGLAMRPAGSGMSARLSDYKNGTAHIGSIRVYRASMTHTCWSDQAIGYYCNVNGWGYESCDNAAAVLKTMKCCATALYDNKPVTNGRATGYSNFACSPITSIVPAKK